MITPGTETNPVFPWNPGGGAMPNLSAIGQTKIFGVDGITITIGAVVIVLALFLMFNMVTGKKRR